MIIDSHTHAWEHWPFSPPVPDPDSRGRLQQLRYEMDRTGIDKAVVIGATLGGNPENNDYVAVEAATMADRIVPFADIDSFWQDTYHKKGSAGRLDAATSRWSLKGFTHYLHDDDTGEWLLTPDGRDFLGVARARGLILSLATRPRQMKAVRAAAEAFPELPILLHHLGHPVLGEEAGQTGIRQILSAADAPNVHVKLSGFGYASPTGSFPYPEMEWIVRSLHDAFGADRLCWGSDHPVVQRFMTYPQAFKVAQRLCAFMNDAEQSLVFGGNIAALLAVDG